jgi:hypothetical protein
MDLPASRLGQFPFSFEANRDLLCDAPRGLVCHASDLMAIAWITFLELTVMASPCFKSRIPVGSTSFCEQKGRWGDWRK